MAHGQARAAPGVAIPDDQHCGVGVGVGPVERERFTGRRVDWLAGARRRRRERAVGAPPRPALQPGGAIVNISGVIAETNLPGMAAYGASKAAVRAFDQALAREARRRNMRVLDARPPHTETGLAQHPLTGIAPRMPQGLAPAHVAAIICDALEAGLSDLPSTAFAP